MVALTDLQWDKHPFRIASQLLAKYPDIETFRLHYYQYVYNTAITTRRCVDYHEVCSREQMTRGYIENQINTLAPARPELNIGAQDMSFTSLVGCYDGSTWHIPQVDFSITSPDSEVFKHINIIAQRMFRTGVEIYTSGHSFHGYVPTLTTAYKWRQWMGQLLLISPPASIPAVDVRWVGHQLHAGCSALRWSRNNSIRYAGYPQLYQEATYGA